MSRQVQRAIILMQESISGKRTGLNFDAIARAVNLSPSRLRHLFKVEIGIAPAQYLKALKLQAAKHLLETTFLTLKQIMVEVGLKDESHFVRDFKRIYGSAPAHYRNQHSSVLRYENNTLEGNSKIGQSTTKMANK